MSVPAILATAGVVSGLMGTVGGNQELVGGGIVGQGIAWVWLMVQVSQLRRDVDSLLGKKKK